MTVSDDWYFDDPNEYVMHVDGRLNYLTNTGTAPSRYDWVRGATSGAIGQIIDGDDLGGTVAGGYIDLTNVIGIFEDTEVIRVLDALAFDGVSNGGFPLENGNVLEAVVAINADGGAEDMDVYAVEYNLPNFTAGEGIAYGIINTTGFLDNEVIDITGGTASIAVVNTAGETDNSALFTTAIVSGNGIAVPGTVTTNESVIIHFDGGNVKDITNSIEVPQDARVQSVTSTAEGIMQRHVGKSALTGSLIIINSDTSGGAWTNNEVLRILDCVYYDGQVAGEVFAEGDLIIGSSSNAKGRVLAIIDDGDSTGKLILGGQTGTFVDADNLQVDSVTIAGAENATNKYLDYADLELAEEGIINHQYKDKQGGIFSSARSSINIIRSCNALYTRIINRFKLQAQMDNSMPIRGDVKDQLYTVLGTTYIPDLSFRFLQEGTFQDAAKNNIWTNLNSYDTSELSWINAKGFNYSATAPHVQSNIYIEQDGRLVPQFWLEGHVDIIIKVKTKTHTSYIDGTVTTIGQLINGGDLTPHCRENGAEYSFSTVNGPGKIVPIALTTKIDTDNATGTHDMAFTAGSGTWLVGEEVYVITANVITKRGYITNGDTGATGNIEYILKSGTNFANADTIVGRTSGAGATASAPTTVVAGYGTNIKIMTVTDEITGGTVTTSGFVIGELVTQAVTGATGYFMTVSAADGMYIEKVNATAFSGATNNITGATGVYTVTSGVYDAAFTTVPMDLGDGSGELNYNAVLGSNITGASAQTIANGWEWTKYLVREEEITKTEGGPGATGAVIGSFYKRLVSTYAFDKAGVFGHFAGGIYFGATGLYIEKDDLVAADLQKMRLLDTAGTLVTPPNLQSMTISGLASGYETASYRTATLGSAIQRTEFQVGAVGSGNNQSADSTILVASQDRTGVPLPNDVPATGILRILDPDPLDTGNYFSFTYTSVDKTTGIFTLGATVGSVTNSLDLILADNVHVVFIEETSAAATVTNSVQYVADIYLSARIREIGKVPRSPTATFTSTGVTIDGTLVDDSVVDQP